MVSAAKRHAPSSRTTVASYLPTPITANGGVGLGAAGEQVVGDRGAHGAVAAGAHAHVGDDVRAAGLRHHAAHEAVDRVAALRRVAGERVVGVGGEELAEAVEVATVDAVGVLGEQVLDARDRWRDRERWDVHRRSLTERR